MSLLAPRQILECSDGYVFSLHMVSTYYLTRKNVFATFENYPSILIQALYFVMTFSHHALVLPFLTQQDLRAVLVFANSSFFLISCFFIIVASLVCCICKYFWFSRRRPIKKFTWAIDNPNKIIKYINWSFVFIFCFHMNLQKTFPLWIADSLCSVFIELSTQSKTIYRMQVWTLSGKVLKICISVNVVTVCHYHVTYDFQSESTFSQFGEMVECSFTN